MNLKKPIFGCLALFALGALFASCSSTKSTSVIVGGDYDATKDVTTYMVFPYGDVELPGKWDKSQYSQSSHQQFFINQDSVIVAVSFAPYNKYEFNFDGALKGADFLLAYHKWEADFFQEQGLECPLIEMDSTNNYIIYKISGTYSDTVIDSFYLIRESKGAVSSYSIQRTDKWSDDKRLEFLKSLLKL